MISEFLVRKLAVLQNDSDWMIDRRLEALQKYKQLPMPSFKYGIRMGLDISALNFTDFDMGESMGKNWIKASDEVVVLPCGEAFEKYDELLRQYFMSSVIAAENKILALHGTLCKGILVYVPKNTNVSIPVEIHVEQLSSVMADHILVIVEKDSSVKIVEFAHSDAGKNRLRTHVVEVIAQENATVEFGTVQQLSRDVSCFTRRFATLAKNAKVNWVEGNFGSKLLQSYTQSVLAGEGAEVSAMSLVYNDGSQVFDGFVSADHVASFTKSSLQSKIVLGDTAKAVSRGLVKVEANAIKCDGYQKQESVLLSDDARVDAVPVLEIANNDVKCAHGSTITQVDPEKVFYLMSRGLSENEAARQIVQGFFDPVVSTLDEQVKEKVQESLSQRLKSVLV